MESCDGPNQYRGRENMARFKYLFTFEEYWKFYLSLMIPIVLDAVVRVITLFYILAYKENKALKSKMMQDLFTFVLYIADIFSVTAFLISIFYLRPNDIVWNSLGRVLMRLIEICLTSKIFRIAKDIPSIWAIRIALSRSAYHLFVPIFFFFTFNITASVFLYFMEPCYNVTSCPWVNLFDVSFYSIVTMTTSKLTSLFIIITIS